MRGFYFFYFGSVGVLLPFLPAYLSALAFTPSQVGALLAIGPAFTLVVPHLWGHWADHSGRPDWVLRVVTFGAAVGFAPLLVARSLPSVGLCLAVYAAFGASATAIADGVVLQQLTTRGGDFSRVRVWGSLGFVATSAAFGRLVGATDLRTIQVTLALMAAYIVCAMAVRLEPGPPRPADPIERGLGRLLRDSGLALFLAATALHWIACAPYHGMLALHVQALGLPLWVVGASAGLGVVAEVGVMFAYPRLQARISPRTALLAAFLGSAVRWLGMAWVRSAVPFVLLNVLHGLTFGAFYIASIGFVANRVPVAYRARGQALFTSCTFGIGGLAGYLTAGAAYQAFGGARLFAAASAVELVAAALVWVGTSAAPLRRPQLS